MAALLRALFADLEERCNAMAAALGALKEPLLDGPGLRVKRGVEELRTGVHEFVVRADLGFGSRLLIQAREYRRLARLVSLAESIQVAPLLAFSSTDRWYTRQLEALARETGWVGLEIAVVASQDRFQSDVDLGLTYMPARRPGLLPLAALAHELGHHALRAWGGVGAATLDAVALRLRTDAAWQALDSEAQSIVIMNWRASWAEELLCDAFATLTLGPSYLWLLFAAVAAVHEDPFRPYGSLRGDHPAPAARVECARRLLGATDSDSVAFDAVWDAYLAPFGQPADEYAATYKLALSVIREKAVTDASGHGLRVRKVGEAPGRLVSSIDQSWTRFRGDPGAFLVWQQEWVSAGL